MRREDLAETFRRLRLVAIIFTALTVIFRTFSLDAPIVITAGAAAVVFWLMAGAVDSDLIDHEGE